MSAGRVFERAFATILHNPIVTVGIALLFGAIPAVFMAYTLSMAKSDLAAGVSGASAVGYGGLAALFSLIGLAVSAVVQGILTKVTVAESEGRRADFGECAQAALRVVLPLIGLSILLAIGVGIGFLLLFVPGVMLYMAWSVAAPALVEENLGVFAAFGRSRELTQGARWKIFGITVLLIAIYYVLTIGLAAVGLATAGTPGPDAAAVGMPLTFMFSNLVINLVVSLFWGAVQASLYVELKDWKDGPASQSLEQVFA